MKITITGSLGNVGKPLTKQLVAAGHQVTVISHSEDRKASIEALGAKAAIGSIQDADFLTKAFTGADAVFVMTPPALGGSNVIANTTNAGKAYATAIKNAKVPRAVMLSTIGADLPAKNGPAQAIYNIEQIYNGVEGTAFRYLRAAYYYTNYYGNIPMIQGMGILGANFPADKNFLITHPQDVATVAAEELQTPFTGKKVRYVVSDAVTPQKIAGTLGAAIGKPELPWVEFTDEQALQGMKQAGIPEEVAVLLVEMVAGYKNGSLYADYQKSGAPVEGKTRLQDFAKEFAGKFKQPAPVG